MPFEMVHEAFLTPDRLDRFKLLILADARGAVGRAVRGDSRATSSAAAACSRRSRRRSTTSRASPRRLRPRRSVRRVVRRAHRRADAELVSQSRRRSGDRPAAPDPRRPRRHAAHHQRRVPDRRHADGGVPVAADADPVLSRSADGGRLPARRAHRHARGVSARDRRAAASSTSRGTSTARSGTCCASITAGCCGTRSRGRRTSRRRWRSKGPGVLDVTVWRQRDSMTVHLVNLTNPMMMKGPLREIIPVGPLHGAHSPAGRRACRARFSC